MANPPPLYPFWNDSQTDLLRKILTNIAFMIENGGGGSGVTSIVAGAGISVDQPTGVVTISATGGSGGGNDFDSATNNTGNTTITPTEPNYTFALTFGGSARTSIIILDVAGRTAGDKIFLDLILPATANIVIDVRNATSGGTRLLPVETFPSQDLTTDGSLLSGHWEFTYNGSAWVFDTSNLPA